MIVSRLSARTLGGIKGSTDSEFLFGLFLEHYGALAGPPGAEKLARGLELVLEELVDMLRELEIVEPALLNLVVTDGQAAAACRAATGNPARALSLHVCAGERFWVEDGDCCLADAAGGSGAVLVTSEALCEGDRWTTVPPDHMVLANLGGKLELRPLKTDLGYKSS
jgi:predicted glutamine amidotransferase